MFAANYTWAKYLTTSPRADWAITLILTDMAGFTAGCRTSKTRRATAGLQSSTSATLCAWRGVGICPLRSPMPPSRNVLGGWKLNSVISLQSGRPFDVYCGLAWYSGCDFNMDGLPYDRPNRPAGIKTKGFSNQQFVNGLFGNPTLSSQPIRVFYGRTSLASQVFCPNGLNSSSRLRLFINPGALAHVYRSAKR